MTPVDFAAAVEAGRMAANISPCGAYRYTLARKTGLAAPDAGAAFFLMLNPSTADAALDDPTIRRCRGFARGWGCAGVVVGNLYALRSTDPKRLWNHSDPVGPENDYWLRQIAKECGDVVCAWGANARPDRVAAVTGMLAPARLFCLGMTKSGAPRHPLYVAADQPLIPWKPQ